MYIFIDESGIHKPNGHSVFSLVYVSGNDYFQLENDVQQLEQNLGIEAFHWAETVWKVKSAFMDRALALPFTAKVWIVHNPIHQERILLTVLMELLTESRISCLFIDGKKSKSYERVIKKFLRDRAISVKKLRSVHDTQYAGIRLADMVAGLVCSYMDGKNSLRLEPYLKRIKRKISDWREQ